ncbi:MAG TPA: hypothetical protein G4O18_09275 [Dehalococcoidia bacterium]|nr:hypothetical protein [Dehalococcoidia bacterium]
MVPFGADAELSDRRATLHLNRNLNRKWVIYGSIIALVAALTTMGIIQVQQMKERSNLNDDIEVAEQLLSVLNAKYASSWQNGTDTQLDGTRASFDTARAELAQPIDSILANDSLFKIAASSSVTLTAMMVSPLYEDMLAELPCSYLPLSVTAEGDLTALLDFIRRLNTDLTNGLVRLVTLSIPEVSDESEPSADIELIIYTYKGE